MGEYHTLYPLSSPLIWVREKLLPKKSPFNVEKMEETSGRAKTQDIGNNLPGTLYALLHLAVGYVVSHLVSKKGNIIYM